MRQEPARTDSRILFVDDEVTNIRLLERVLRQGGYEHIQGTTDPRRVLDLMAEFDPDVVLLDLAMPDLDGFEVMERLRGSIPAQSLPPILVLTADANPETKRRALAGGAKDFLTKPFDVEEVLLRIRNMLETRRLYLRLQNQNYLLESRVKERTRELEDSYVDTFERLARASELRDDATGQHIWRVGRTAALVAAELGLSDADVQLIERAAGLHDVGKVGVPDSILLAPRQLTVEEFEVVKTHTAMGAKILSGSPSPLLRLAEKIAWAHHERWDGLGYAGLTGEAIPLEARITTVADVFDALINERPYKEAWTVEHALEEIRAERGWQFDPSVVDAFLRVQERARTGAKEAG